MNIDLAQLRKVLDDALDNKLAGLEERLEQKLEQKLEEKLEQKLAQFYGQICRQLDDRFANFEQRIDRRIDSLYIMVDGFVGRMDSDDAERAAMNNQLNRHTGWIGELAISTKTKLSSL